MKNNNINISFDTPFVEQILDSITEAVFTVDTDFNIQSFNKAAMDLTGKSSQFAIGKKCFDIFSSSVCGKKCPLRKAMKFKKHVKTNTAYCVNKKGIQTPLDISATPIYNNQKQVIGGVETIRDITQIETLRKKINVSYNFYDIISRSPLMMELFTILPDIAESESSVVIEGKSGTGKELFARAIHSLSKRRNHKLISINCGALPDTLLESELFGYKQGAFTDAKKDKLGRFALAENGTLFLDEIESISMAMQVKLLRVLQEKEYEPLGSTKTIKTNVRIIVASNKSIKDLIANGSFREDLYYRLGIMNIILPDLHERLEDIPLLVDQFLIKYNAITKREIKGISVDAMNILMTHNYPGNVRELENIIEHSFILCKSGYILPQHLPKNIIPLAKIKKIKTKIGFTLDEMEYNYIFASLKRNKWNKLETAKELGINKTTLWRKMKRFNIELKIENNS